MIAIDSMDNPTHWRKDGMPSRRNPSHPKNFNFEYDARDYAAGLLEAIAENPIDIDWNRKRFALARLHLQNL